MATVRPLELATTNAGLAERAKLRRELTRLDTIFFLISAMVVVDTVGAIAIGGGQAFTWLVVLFVSFFIPSALASAELGAAVPDEGGAYVRVRMAFGRFAGALTSLLYWRARLPSRDPRDRRRRGAARTPPATSRWPSPGPASARRSCTASRSWPSWSCSRPSR